jgi:arginase
MPRTIGLVGAPSSAGAHWPDQEKAPAALRAGGLIERLRDGGLSVDDHGDLPRVRFHPDKRQRHQQNLPAVVEVTAQVADRVEATLRADQIPLVLGGDCTIEPGVLAGALRSERGGNWASSTSTGMWTSTPPSRVPRASSIRWGWPT